MLLNWSKALQLLPAKAERLALADAPSRSVSAPAYADLAHPRGGRLNAPRSAAADRVFQNRVPAWKRFALEMAPSSNLIRSVGKVQAFNRCSQRECLLPTKSLA